MQIWGVNNRVTSLKEALALGELLGRTVIAHDVGIPSYDYKGHRNVLNRTGFTMDFTLLFDYDYLARQRSVVLLDDHLASGWDGKLDAVVVFRDQNRLKSWDQPHPKVTMDGAKVIDYGKTYINCDKNGIAELARLIEPYINVGFVIFLNTNLKAGHGLVPNQGPTDMCSEAYYKVNTGLNLWRSSLADFDYVAASKACQNPNLVHIVVNQTLDAIKRYNVSSNVFVMCHPAVRDLILELYGAAGMKPLFFNEDILGPIFGFRYAM
ncbi:hypothetical protein PLESTM_001294100 [Pleodorina starrii]|nr:hypothetical protein PLESTM_001294100 [Pleodorina starrii]